MSRKHMTFQPGEWYRTTQGYQTPPNVKLPASGAFRCHYVSCGMAFTHDAIYCNRKAAQPHGIPVATLSDLRHGNVVHLQEPPKPVNPWLLLAEQMAVNTGAAAIAVTLVAFMTGHGLSLITVGLSLMGGYLLTLRQRSN